ncbi:MAG: OsmC family protein [Thermoplasmata archaeon]|nr:OsmC family protein [Thermoplasmata archaeon]MVT15288.1 OsmC family peroxiredoxin [Euryarchaeota archaeon]
MKVIINQIEGDKFLSVVDGKHSVVVDGERSVAPSAMDFLLVGIGSCTAIDVVDILRKMREPLEHLIVEVDGQRAEEPPRVYTTVNLHYIAYGNIKRESLERAINLSQEKYCSASVMFKRSGTKINVTYDIIKENKD